jgi:hypothetical protein
MAKISINMDSLKSQREFKRHKINPGISVYRILPPFGTDNKGYPFRKWMLVWGLVDPTSGRMRPYVSSLQTENRCPVFEYVRDLQSLAEEMKVSGASKDEMKFVNELIGRIRPKTSFFYNAADQAGQVGVLEIKKTAHDKLKKLMNEYIRDYNQDPTSLQSEEDDSGVWFEFSRTGEGFDTEYDVKKHQTKSKIDGRVAFVDNREPLPDSVSSNYDQLAYDIHSLYSTTTYEDLEEILLANIKAWNLPERFRCGRAVEKTGTIKAAAEVARTTPASTSSVKPTVSKRPAPSIKLTEEDDLPQVEDDLPVSVGASVAKSADPDEIFAMARKILNN